MEDGTQGVGTVKRFLFVNRRAPWGTAYALEALDAVLIAAAFDQDVSVLFVDDGVYQIKKGQDTRAIGVKNCSPAYGALATCDVDKLYVERESLEARGLGERDLLVPVRVLGAKEVAELMDQQDVILSF